MSAAAKNAKRSDTHKAVNQVGGMRLFLSIGVSDGYQSAFFADPISVSCNTCPDASVNAPVVILSNVGGVAHGILSRGLLHPGALMFAA